MSKFFKSKSSAAHSPAASLPLILLADDDENDVLFMRIALEEAAIRNPLFVVNDGQETIEYLAGEGPYADRNRHPLPQLLILDLNMPRMSGFDVLTWLQHRAKFNELPIVVLSSSSLENDIRKAKQLGAHDYRVKPPHLENLVALVHDLHARWLKQSNAQPPNALPVSR